MLHGFPQLVSKITKYCFPKHHLVKGWYKRMHFPPEEGLHLLCVSAHSRCPKLRALLPCRIENAAPPFAAPDIKQRIRTL